MRTKTAKLEVGHHVLFRVIDVVNREAFEIITSASPQLIVRGEIDHFSDGGLTKQKYAVLRVEGLSDYLVVPTAQLWPI